MCIRDRYTAVLQMADAHLGRNDRETTCAAEDLRGSLEWLLEKSPIRPLFRKLHQQMSALLAEPSKDNVREVATHLGMGRRDMYTHSLLKQVDPVKTGFIQYVRDRQSGLLGFLTVKDHNETVGATCSSVQSRDSSDVAQLAAKPSSSNVLTVRIQV